jgi:hypothetical protein
MQEQFEKIYGRYPTVQEADNLSRIKSIFRLSDIDSMWSVIFMIQHCMTDFREISEGLRESSEEINKALGGTKGKGPRINPSSMSTPHIPQNTLGYLIVASLSLAVAVGFGAFCFYLGTMFSGEERVMLQIARAPAGYVLVAIAAFAAAVMIVSGSHALAVGKKGNPGKALLICGFLVGFLAWLILLTTVVRT